MKAVVLYGVPDLPGLVAMSIYDTNHVSFLLMCCNVIEWFQKEWQVYDRKTQMVRDAYFLRLDVNDS